MLKVLVVDDDKFARRGIIAEMPWADFDMEVVGEASNGKQALEFMEGHAVDLLITDLAMPVMSGLDLMREVQRQYSHVWFLVLTFHQDFELIQEALRLGAIDYIAKTQIEQTRMEDVLARACERIVREQGKATHPGWSDAELRAAREAWSSLAWVTRDEAFCELLRQIEEAKPSAAQLESVFYSARIHWLRVVPEDTLLREALPGTSANWTDWVEWLNGVRSLLRGCIIKPAYSVEVTQSIMKAVDYIHRYLDADIRHSSLAKEASMSKGYFSQCFKDIVGATFHDYIRDARMENARLLLTETEYPIYRVAEQCGYPNEKYFSRVFREQVGVLPSEYRRVGGVK